MMVMMIEMLMLYPFPLLPVHYVLSEDLHRDMTWMVMWVGEGSMDIDGLEGVSKPYLERKLPCNHRINATDWLVLRMEVAYQQRQ